MKLFCTLLYILILNSVCFALTSDTIHVKKYDITLDTINYTTQSLSARTTVIVESKLNGVSNITLSLYKFTIDSIISGSQQLAYTYNDSILHITPPSTLNQNDTSIITIVYHGKTHTDSYFGGFYFIDTYAFNIGAAFNADPHVDGRAWFPCIDEFVDKSIYIFHITTDSAYKAFCNGALDSVYNRNGLTTWHWSLDKPIPSYLAAVAVAPFYTIYRNYQGIPVQVACMPADSSKTIGTLLHLDSCLYNYINAYGPYPFNKVGFVCLPFDQGGMEHATSIHIGKDYFDGTLTFETLWAHELSHMWWGDKVTCKTEEDMWLNEGFATSNEHLFVEWFYGRPTYQQIIRSNHRRVLQFAHIADSGYYALNNVPHAYTYGFTSYLKGADIVHTLREYLGDSAYFTACRAFLNNFAFGNAASADLRNQFANASGIDLTNFFNDWVFTPGFPHFSIDSFTVTPHTGKYDVSVFTRQKQKGNNHIYSVPVECTFSNGIKDSTVIMLINEATNSFTYSLDFNPLQVTLDKEDKMADATVADEQRIAATGVFGFAETNASIKVLNTGSDTSTIRIEHHYVAPDNFKNIHGIRVSDYHYYSIDGILKPGFLASATFIYNGSLNPSSGFLDNTLISGTEDSLVILYRSGTADDWHIVNAAKQNFGSSHTDKVGNFTVDTLKKGEYCFGYYDYRASLTEESNHQICLLKASPNPVSDGCLIQFSLPFGKNGILQIANETGQQVYSTQVFSHQQFVKWDTFKQKNGIYFASLYLDGEKATSIKIIVNH